MSLRLHSVKGQLNVQILLPISEFHRNKSKVISFYKLDKEVRVACSSIYNVWESLPMMSIPCPSMILHSSKCYEPVVQFFDYAWLDILGVIDEVIIRVLYSLVARKTFHKFVDGISIYCLEFRALKTSRWGTLARVTRHPFCSPNFKSCIQASNTTLSSELQSSLRTPAR